MINVLDFMEWLFRLQQYTHVMELYAEIRYMSVDWLSNVSIVSEQLNHNIVESGWEIHRMIPPYFSGQYCAVILSLSKKLNNLRRKYFKKEKKRKEHLQHTILNPNNIEVASSRLLDNVSIIFRMLYAIRNVQ